MLNRRVLSVSPCFIPLVLEEMGISLPLIITLYVVFSYIDLIMSNILPAIPSFLILCNMPFPRTELNAFSRSTKQVYSFMFCVIYLFTIVFNSYMWSVAIYPLRNAACYCRKSLTVFHGGQCRIISPGYCSIHQITHQRVSPGDIVNMEDYRDGATEYPVCQTYTGVLHR